MDLSCVLCLARCLQARSRNLKNWRRVVGGYVDRLWLINEIINPVFGFKLLQEGSEFGQRTAKYLTRKAAISFSRTTVLLRCTEKMLICVDSVHGYSTHTFFHSWIYSYIQKAAVLRWPSAHCDVRSCRFYLKTPYSHFVTNFQFFQTCTVKLMQYFIQQNKVAAFPLKSHNIWAPFTILCVNIRWGSISEF